MDGMTDRYLQRLLKNWAAQQRPPENARARLLLIASAQTYPLDESQIYLFEEHYSKINELFDSQMNQPARAMDLLWMFHMPTPELRMI
jgi:hypothetical protein